MNRPPSLESSATLRVLVQTKRARGQAASALVLAQLGSRIAAHEKIAEGRDEVSRLALARYLELMPEDAEVRQALEQLQHSTRRKITKPRPWFLLFALGGISTAGAIHLNGLPLLADPEPSTLQRIVIVRAPPRITVPAMPPVPADPIVIRAVGDVVLGSDFPKSHLPDKSEQQRIAALRAELRSADIVVGNLEGVLSDRGKAYKDLSKPNRFAFRMPEGYATTLREMGFDVMSLANNHSLDFGAPGLASTVRALQEAGIQPVGVPGAETALVKVRGASVAFLNYSYLPTFTRLDDEQRITSDIKQASAAADLVVVTVHGGKEGIAAIGAPNGDEYFLNEYRGDILKFSRLVIDAGACAVFGHGPHVVRPFELYKGKPIFFSLGNFVGYRSLSTKGKLSNSIVAEVRLNPRGELLGAGIIPLKLDRTGIPHADYSAASLDTLDLLLAERLEKRPVLELALHGPAAASAPSATAR